MAQIRTRHGRKTGTSVARLAQGRPRTPSVFDRNGPDTVGCAANPECAQPVLPEAPIPLCGKHIREVYEFAQDFLSERWDSAVREYVSDLHETFKPPRPVTTRPRQGHVYFVRFGDRVKIGFSTDPTKRLRNVPHDEVLGVIHGTREDEQAWHQLLDDFRITGEWFRADPDLLAALERVIKSAS